MQEEIVVREALLEAPALWWKSIGSVFNHSAFDVLSEWRERKVRCLFCMFPVTLISNAVNWYFTFNPFSCDSPIRLSDAFGRVFTPRS